MIPPNPSPSALARFYRNLQGLPPRDVLRLCCLSLRTGTLHFIQPAAPAARVARVGLNQGVICSAGAGTLTGTDAVRDLFDWPASTLEWDEQEPRSDGTRLTWPDASRLAPHQTGAPPSRSTPGASSRLLEMSPALTVLTDVAEPRPVAIAGPVLTLGRAPSNDIPLYDAGISNHHCRLRLEGDLALLEDLNSSNGTFLNGQPVREAALSDGDLIRIGTTLLKFELLAPPTTAPFPSQVPGAANAPQPAGTAASPGHDGADAAPPDLNWLLWIFGTIAAVAIVTAAFFWILTLVL